MVHVIAHSRGNWPTINALNAIATEPQPASRARFSQIVLTAPDVDADSFKVLVRRFNTVAERTTLYASANDEALRLSKRYQGYQRAGDVVPEIVVTLASTVSTCLRLTRACSATPTTVTTRR